MTCPRCKAAYADGKPEDFGSEPECAFKTEVFDSSNWQCATMNALRERAEGCDEGSSNVAYCADQWAGIVPISKPEYGPGCGDFIVLGWYKHRGRTEQAWVMHNPTQERAEMNRLITPLTLEEAHRALGEER